MNDMETVNGCTVYPDSRFICGIKHHLVQSPKGDLFWVDDLFLSFIRNRGSENRNKLISHHYGLTEEIISKGFKAVEGILFSETAVDYFKPETEKYHNPDYNPLVSIIIVNWNGERHLRELILSIRAQSYTNYELIIVDNNSDDDSIGIIESFENIRLLKQKKNLGFCRGNNIGIGESKGEIVFLLNNDTVLDNSCLENAVKRFERSPEDTIGVFPKILFYDNPGIINCEKTQWHCVHLWRDNSVGMIDIMDNKESEQVFGGIFAGVFILKEKFERLGLFDKRFVTYGEDFDVCYRANLAGYKFFSEPASVVYHKYRASSQEETDIFFTLYYFLRNYLLVLLKNYELKNLRNALGYFRKEFWSPWSSRARDQRDREVRRLLRRVVASLIVLLPHIVFERIKIKRMRKVSDSDLWVFDNIDNFNIFHYEGRVVLNRFNLLTSLYGNARYESGGREYVVFGLSNHLPGRR